MLYAQDQLAPEEPEKEEIDLTELSHIIACKDVICNYNSLQSLTEPSIEKLIQFYSSFARAELKKNDNNYQEEYVSSYLLKSLSVKMHLSFMN